MPAAIRKPAPANLQFALVAAPEFEHAFASLAPGRPQRQPDRPPAELPQGRAMAWERGVEIADFIARPLEHKLDLREVSRPTPRIALDLRIVPPESLETERRPLAIPVTHAAPAEASLWNSPSREFAIELVSLSEFADAQFLQSNFEAPALTGGSELSAVAQSLLPEPQPAAVESEPPPQETEASFAESQSAAPMPTGPDTRSANSIPLPVSSTAESRPCQNQAAIGVRSRSH